jgi:hypothetical protein
MDRIGFRIKQDGIVVARVDGPPDKAEREIMHYAAQYRQDGEITIQHNANGHWKRFALLCQWPLPGDPA